ncbi:MAG: WecB/TagA/CpsF family glycosyltransferase [Verrucomicrobiales bacterium]|nr:WecB/TagA/CpsF family glycosyltransferase [Verrucomicrobiales bacterium]MCP5526688.1 WecB/TagA/CpsF family glycosyltransferase [Verrucomicrobiales bacterium]
MSATPPAPSTSRPPIAILGVPFDNVTTADTLRLVGEMIATGKPHYLVTANVDFVVQAQADLELRRILHDAHLVVADGMPLVWASRWLGNPLPERVTGSGMTPLLLAEAERQGWRVYFLGGTEESVARAATETRRRHPRLELVGAYSPPFRPLLEMDHDDILRRLREARPDILLVAFGCPKQEKWLNMHHRAAGVPVGIGVGATIDFLAGTMRRAPVWMQRAGLEWLYRLAQEPRRLFRRYFTDLWVFGWAIIRQLRELRGRRRENRGARTLEAQSSGTGEDLVLRLPSELDAATVRGDEALRARLGAHPGNLILECAEVTFADSTAFGLLIRLQKECRARDRQLVLAGPSPALRRGMELMKLTDFFAQASDLAAALALVAERTREQAVVRSFTLGGNAETVRWTGEITAARTAEIRALTEHLLDRPEADVALDLSQVRFIDSSGIGLLVSLRKRAGRTGARFAIRHPSPAVREVARLLHLETYLLGSRS